MVNYNVKINSYIDTESTTEELVLEKAKELVKELDRKNDLLVNKNKNVFTKLYYISPLIGKLYIVVTEADAKGLGLENTILLNTNIKDYSYSKLPSKIIVYRELIIKKGQNITTEDELNLAQAIADNTFKKVAPFQIPIVKIINYNNNSSSTTLVLPSIFGDNIFRVDDTIKVTTTGDSEAGHKVIDDLNEDHKEYKGSKPIAEYRMDEPIWNGTPGEVKDSSGNGYNGTAHGAVTEIATDGGICHVGKFDGRNDYVDVGNVLNPGSDDWSISVWIKWNGRGGDNMIYNKEGLYEGKVRDGYFRFAWQPYWQWSGGRTTPITANEWTHIVVTYDHETQKIYKNGTLTYTRVQTGDIGSNDSKLLIGARGNTKPWSYFKGNIDEFKVFDVALSPEQTQEIYNNEKDKKNYDGSTRVCQE